MISDIKSFHDEILIWDAHRDVAHELPLKDRYLRKLITDVDLDLDIVRTGGINVEVYAICTAIALGLDPAAQALIELERILEIIENNSDKVLLATTTQHVLEAKKTHKLAAFIHFEGAEPILKEIDLLRIYYRLGLRSMGLTWNLRNEIADGSYEGDKGAGLSNFGRTVVKEMNRLGILIDIAHMTKTGMRDVISLSEKPIILSHGAVAAVRAGHHRAYGDDILELIAENDGVFCITTIPETLADRRSDASLSKFLDHIDHAVSVMGIEHVGLGADFDVYLSRLGLPMGSWTIDLEEADNWPNVTKALIGRGYSTTDTRKIMGENLYSLFNKVID